MHPRTKTPIPARIIEREDGVFMEKQLGNGETELVRLEKDPALYQVLSDPRPAGPRRFPDVYFYVTSKCNLNCPVCYEATRKDFEPSLDDMKATLRRLRRRAILLCGAEPTCRAELPEIIIAASKRNRTYLLTNGIRLADMGYARSLKEAGLRYVALAFNGLNDEAYRRINGEALLEVKLKALENIRQLGMTAFLSMTVVRGVNDDQIRPVVEFYMDQPFIWQVRLRAMAPLGSYLSAEPIFMSELLQMTCDALGMDRELILRQQAFLDEFGKAFSVDYIRPMLCNMKIDFNSRMVPLASEYDPDRFRGAFMRRPRLAARLLRAWGAGYVMRYAFERLGRPTYVKPSLTYRISLRVWPSLATLDLERNNRCMALYWRDGKLTPFCLCNVLHGG